MTQTPHRSPMERQGELLQDLAGVLLASLDLDEGWVAVGAAFLPHGEGWAGRLVVTDREGTASGGDAAFAKESQVTTLLDALQRVSAEQSQAFVSCRLEIGRSVEEPERISLRSELEHDRDPGSLDGLGGVDAEYARRLVERVGGDRVPAWVRELASTL